MWKIEPTRLIARIVRVTHDIGIAEELAQDALPTALELSRPKEASDESALLGTGIATIEERSQVIWTIWRSGIDAAIRAGKGELLASCPTNSEADTRFNEARCASLMYSPAAELKALI